MTHKKTLVIVGTILALGASLEADTKVGYFTDGVDNNNNNQSSDTGPAPPIIANGFTPVQITNIATFDLNTISILLIDEFNVVGPTAALLGRSTALSNWVAGGGVIAIHDRTVCTGTCTPVPGSAGISFTKAPGNNIDVETSVSTLVTNGQAVNPSGQAFGAIGNTTLDGGNFSHSGYVTFATLPAGAVAILNNGTSGNEVAVSYRFGSGFVYYSTIPLDFYLNQTRINAGGSIPAAFHTIYAPNMVAYLGSLAASVVISSPPGATGAPTLSGWGLWILAILLMGCAAVMLRSGPREGSAR
jgi:hypothetical protein